MKHNSSMNMAMTIKGLGTDKADLFEGNKMADEGKSLDELIEEAEALLELEKPRKRKKGESEFEFYRDSLTGHRTTKHKYRPRCRRPTSQSTATCTSNSLEDQSLEEVLEKCQAFLDTVNTTADIKWERRMAALNENWAVSRPLIFKALLLSQSPGSTTQQCDVCHDAPWVVRCDECSGRRMCYKCDSTIHDQLLFHDREAWTDGCFKYIPPTFVFTENGKMEQTRRHLFYSHLLCPQCREKHSLVPCLLPGSVIIVNQKGRFDFSNYAAICNCCGHKVNPWSLERIIAAGYWPGSPKDLTYLFDQNLFRQWDFVQKRLPGTSETSFLKALGDFSLCKGRASTITATTFSRAFKEWKFCMYELQNAQDVSWMECPACSLNQHSCHVDGNMKLYRFKSSGIQKRPCYYGAAFISQKNEVDSHIKAVYSKAPRAKNVTDSMCGESHWKAAENSARRRAKLDETGLEIAGCRHGLAQWAVNMYQGEIFGYFYFLQSQKMFPAGVNFFWEDIVCKYWKWAGKVGGSEMTMKPALSVMHAKAHKWSCQVLWGGHWQEGSACTTGEEVEQINAHMSRCGNTSKYMLPEGRDELITEHAVAWNQRKICAMVTNLAKRFKRASAMCASSKDNCVAILQQYNLQLKDVNVLLWKEEIIRHAKNSDSICFSPK
ncbi:uncharacterized protein LOC122955576 isoform X2 [Acropora millepora]|uniref:uncharacterized protein LOC122955576 isoform X2 n=1 Tax=Acropora millepora TaxID=45264 RepID=UPI001CF5222F|nr:uncharacterized protein LOC122955576 isoform X2 [Acropora millepora]